MRASLLLAITATAVLPACTDLEPDEQTSTSEAGLINNPTDGGPFGGNVTIWCSNQPGSYCYGPGYAAPLLTATSSVVSRMDAAALNWGCSNQAGLFGVGQVTAVNGGFYKWYGVTGNGGACGVVYWNNARQAAYFVANTDRQCNTTSCASPLPLNNTSSKLYAKFAALGWHDSVLGLPISNPVPYGWNATTYQLFANGIITYRNGQSAAYYAGGTGTRKVVTDRFLAGYGVSPTSGSPIWGLTRDIANTCITAGALDCTSIDDTGDYLAYWDAYFGLPGYVVARDGWSQAYEVIAPLAKVWNNNIQSPIYNGGTPWSGSTVGFPLGNVTTVGTAASGQPIQTQQFERGALAWQPKGCPASPASCPAAGSGYCTTYGSISTNYLASFVKQSSTAVMSDDVNLGLCPSTATIAPICDGNTWVRVGPTVKYRYKCASPQANPLTITLQILAPGGWWYDIELPSSAYREWLLGGDVPSALAYWGIPSETAVHRNNRQEVDWVEFPSGRLYTGVVSGNVAGVHKGIWTKYASLGAETSDLGWPLTSSTPATEYPRYQYFTSGYRIDATSDTDATVVNLFGDCVLVCQNAARIGEPSVQCLQNGQPSTCGAWGYSTGDADLDAIPDALETALIARFRPWMRGQCGSSFTQAYGVLAWTGDCAAQIPAGPIDLSISDNRRNGGAFASAVVRYTNSSSPGSAALAGTPHSTWDGGVDRGFNCGKKGQPDGSAFEDRRCIEIIYTTPYNWDLGDPQTGFEAHSGDNEVITVLVARRDPYSYNRPPRWGKSLGQATSASDWYLIKSFGSAHLGRTPSDSSTFRTYTGPTDAAPTTTTQVTAFVARGKNGNYWSDSSCDEGGDWFDDCDDSNLWQLTYYNAGEQRSHPDGTFPGNKLQHPASSSNRTAAFFTPPDYDMWSMTVPFSYFESGGVYGQILRRGFMMWARGGVQYQTPADDGLCTFVQQGGDHPTVRSSNCDNPEDPWW